MQAPRVRFNIGRLMTVVAVAAVVLTPVAWTPPEDRWRTLYKGVTIVAIMAILSTSFLADRIGGGGAKLRPRTARKVPVVPPWSLFRWPLPPHRRGAAKKPGKGGELFPEL